MSTREICFPIRTILGYRYSCIDKIRYPGEEEVSIYRRGFSPASEFSHLLTFKRRRFLLCKYIVDELKEGLR